MSDDTKSKMAFVLQSKHARKTDEHSKDVQLQNQTGEVIKSDEKKTQPERKVTVHGYKYDGPQNVLGWCTSGMVSKNNSKQSTDLKSPSLPSTDLGNPSELVEKSDNKDLREDINVYEDPFAITLFKGLPHPKELFGKKRRTPTKRKLHERHISSFDSHLHQIHRKQAKLEAMSAVWRQPVIIGPSTDTQETTQLPPHPSEDQIRSKYIGFDPKQKTEE